MPDEQCLAHMGPLVQGLTASWPRRSHTLLELGCGDGKALDLLWPFGFDVTGVEHSPQLLEQARARFGCRGDFHLGPCDDAPFDDQSFDYVIIFTAFFHLPNNELETLLAEAVRLASKSVLCIFPNAWSLARLASMLPTRARSRLCGSCTLASGYNPFSVLRQIWRLGAGRHWIMRGILPGPGATWSTETRFGKTINNRLLLGPVGAYVGIRLDVLPPVSMTGLPLRVKAAQLMAGTSPVTTRNATQGLPES